MKNNKNNNNKKNPLANLIVKASIFFFGIMLLTSVFVFIYGGILYSTVSNVSDNDEGAVKNKYTDNVVVSNNDITNEISTTGSSFVVVERNRNYKIYVDTETRNMYITPNTYPNESYTMIYDGDSPKIYTGTINNETYEMFLNKEE